MTSIAVKVLKGAYSYLPEINSATLSGAIDIIVTESKDGTLQCTPFHVRFGKFQILRPRDRLITIEVNGQLTDLTMKLGSAGEAFFYHDEELAEDLMPSPAISPVLRPASPDEMSKSGAMMMMPAPTSPSGSEGETENKLPRKSRSGWNFYWSWGRLPNKEPPMPQGKPLLDMLQSLDQEEQIEVTIPCGHQDECKYLDSSGGGVVDDVQPSQIQADTEEEESSISAVPASPKLEALDGINETLNSNEQMVTLEKRFEAPLEIEDDEVDAEAEEDEAEDDISSGDEYYTKNTNASVWPSHARQQRRRQKKKIKGVEGIESKVESIIVDDAEDSVDYENREESINADDVADVPSTLVVCEPSETIIEMKATTTITTTSPSSEVSLGAAIVPPVLGIPAIEMALCKAKKGETLPLDAEPMIKMFEENIISYDHFVEHHATLLEDSGLMVRFNGRIYPFKVALPLLLSVLTFNRELSVSQNKNVPKKSTWMGWLLGGDKGAKNDDPKQLQQQQQQQQQQQISPSSAATAAAVAVPQQPQASPTSSSGLVEPLEANEKMPVSSSSSVVMLSSDDEEAFVVKRSHMSLYPSKEQLKKLPLQDGPNTIRFKLLSRYVEATIYKWSSNSKVVISDIDGTITKSDVLGHILPLVGADWSQRGVAGLLSRIRDNGYHLLYVTARPIGQVARTKNYLQGISQDGWSLPEGPVLTSPDRLMQSFTREVIRRKPQEFKIACLRNVAALFDANPFFAGFGNRPTDVESYSAVGIPPARTFIINSSGEIRNAMNVTYKTSYESMHRLVDVMFAPLKNNEDDRPHEDFNYFNYWRTEYSPTPSTISE